MIEEARPQFQEEARAGAADEPVLEEGEDAHRGEEHEEEGDHVVQPRRIGIDERGVDHPAGDVGGGEAQSAAHDHEQGGEQEAAQVPAGQSEKSTRIDGEGGVGLGGGRIGHGTSGGKRAARILRARPARAIPDLAARGGSVLRFTGT